jgi:hypothetical protein
VDAFDHDAHKDAYQHDNQRSATEFGTTDVGHDHAPQEMTMTSYLRTIWAEAPPIVRATLHAAWIGSKIGAISLATLFTIANLGAGAYDVAAGKMQY